MKQKITLLATLALLMIFAACNKDRRISKRLIKPGEWKVTELSVGGVADSILPKWKINSCEDIFEEVCTGRWISPTDTAEFYWQFNDKANEFVISYAIDTAKCDSFYTDVSAFQSFNYSGTYEVTRHKRKEMEFESMSTLGYPGDKVVVRIEKE